VPIADSRTAAKNAFYSITSSARSGKADGITGDDALGRRGREYSKHFLRWLADAVEYLQVIFDDMDRRRARDAI
jgi:hypothetical protein